MKSKAKKSILPKKHYPLFFLEAFLVIFFTILIIITVNFFNFINLSLISPVFDQLPKQAITKKTQRYISVNSNSQIATPPLGGLKTLSKNKIVVKKGESLLFTNDKNEYSYFPLKDSEIKILKGFQVRATFALSFNYLTYNPELSSGYAFENGLADDNRRVIYIFFFPKTSTWTLQYEYGQEKQVFTLYKANIDGTDTDVLLDIADNGKDISVQIPNGEIKKFSLNNSFYDVTNTMKSGILLAPLTILKMNKLIYYY